MTLPTRTRKPRVGVDNGNYLFSGIASELSRSGHILRRASLELPGALQLPVLPGGQQLEPWVCLQSTT